MEDKTQYEALMDELQKIVENFRVGFADIGESLSKLLPDVEIPDEEEDTWEMKCPYKNNDECFILFDDGDTSFSYWAGDSEDVSRFRMGNVFPTLEAAELESKRRNLLTRFKAFRDECNGDWKADWNDCNSKKWIITKNEEEIYAMWTNGLNIFSLFGHFKNQEDCERAIELFGDEIEELFVEV